MPEYQCGHCAVKHTIAEKLKTLVMGNAMTAMGERLAQQLRLVEDVAKLSAECIDVHSLISRIHCAGSFCGSPAYPAGRRPLPLYNIFPIYQAHAATFCSIPAIQ